MEESYVTKSYIGVVLFCLVVFSLFFVLPIVVSFSFGGGDRLDEYVALSSLQTVLFFNACLSLFLIFLLFKPFLLIKTFNRILVFYVIFILTAFFLFFSFSEKGGFLFKKIKNTEAECRILSFSLDQTDAEYCYDDLAIMTNNINYCKYTDSFGTSDCYYYFAKNQNNFVCPKDGSDICHLDIALNTKNPILCEKVNDVYKKKWCFGRLAEKMKDKTLCAKADLKDRYCELYNY